MKYERDGPIIKITLTRDEVIELYLARVNVPGGVTRRIHQCFSDVTVLIEVDATPSGAPPTTL